MDIISNLALEKKKGMISQLQLFFCFNIKFFLDFYTLICKKKINTPILNVKCRTKINLNTITITIKIKLLQIKIISTISVIQKKN